MHRRSIQCLSTVTAVALMAGIVSAAEPSKSSGLPPIPRAVSSLGAIAQDGYLYVYGGHAGTTHTYSTTDVLGTFHRLKLDGKSVWEELPGGPIAQGMNLASHGGKIYRIGGMQPRNKTGDPAHLHSLTSCARFDPTKRRWESLPDLPAGRSSHDVVAVGDKLVVVGGWQQKGADEKPTWHDTALILDLTAPKLAWESVPQPFQRRALTASAIGTKVYVIGGLGAEGKATEVFDLATRTWSKAAALPGEGARSMSFSPAATTLGDRIIVATASGGVYRLSQDGSAWEKVGTATPRIVARMIPLDANSVLLVGGAAHGKGNISELETVKLTTPATITKP